jgi:hypothetical protein
MSASAGTDANSGTVAGSAGLPTTAVSRRLTSTLFLGQCLASMAFVAGITVYPLISVSLKRGQTQGVSELAVGLSAGSASLLSGVILAAFGFLGLCLIGTLIAAVPIALLLRDRLHTAAPSSV